MAAKSKAKARVLAGRDVTLEEAIAEDSFEWMARQAPRLLDAVSFELSAGRTPEDVRQIVSRQVGPERQALATRCYQAARWIYKYGGA